MSILKLSIVIGFVFSATPVAADDGVLVMGYPEREKLPLIDAAPSNEGVFYDLYTAVAKRLGLKLEIRRVPKKRLYDEMNRGTIDFYPAAAFSASRAEFMHWIDNGLKSKEVCLTRKNVPTIADLTKIPDMRLAAELGGVKFDPKEFPQIKVLEFGAYVDIDTAVKVLTRDEADLYFVDIEVVDHFKKVKKVNALEELGIKLHPDCIEKFGPTYMGFSRKSAKFSEKPNPAYKADQPLSGTNQPSLLDTDSVAGKAAAILRQMKKSGEAQRIYERHIL